MKFSMIQIYIAILILICCCPFIYLYFRSLAKIKNGIFLGITVPEDKTDDKGILYCRARYLKLLNRIFLLLILIPSVTLLFPWFSVNFSIFSTWVLMLFLLPCIPFIKYHNWLKRYKLKNQWNSAAAGKKKPDIQSLLAGKTSSSFLRFIIPIFISILPFIREVIRCFTRPECLWHLLPLGLVVIPSVIYLIINLLLKQQPDEKIGLTPSIDRALTKIRNYNWSRCCLWLAWLNAIYAVYIWFFIVGRLPGITWFMTISTVYFASILLLCLRAEYEIRRTQQKLTTGTIFQEDDDVYWLHGIFYYNENDNRSFIKRRLGIGLDTNLAKPLGRFVFLITLLCTLILPILSMSLFFEEFSPIILKERKEKLVVTHTSREYSIPLANIEKTERIKQLPKASRKRGIAFDNLYKGVFEVEGYGKAYLCLRPTEDDFLVLYTKKRIYILSPEDTDIQSLHLPG